MNRRSFLSVLPAIPLALGLAAKEASYFRSSVLPLDEYAKLVGIVNWQAHVQGMSLINGGWKSYSIAGKAIGEKEVAELYQKQRGPFGYQGNGR